MIPGEEPQHLQRQKWTPKELVTVFESAAKLPVETTASYQGLVRGEYDIGEHAQLVLGSKSFSDSTTLESTKPSGLIVFNWESFLLSHSLP